jgi:hypothetical protein
MKCGKSLKLGLLGIVFSLISGCSDYHRTPTGEKIRINYSYCVVKEEATTTLYYLPGFGFTGTRWIDRDGDKNPDEKYVHAVARVGRSRVEKKITEYDRELFQSMLEKAEEKKRLEICRRKRWLKKSQNTP